MARETCARCNASVLDGGEMCWWCEDNLCGECWDAVGHCGHEGADLINRCVKTTEAGQAELRGLFDRYPRVPLRAT